MPFRSTACWIAPAFAVGLLSSPRVLHAQPTAGTQQQTIDYAIPVGTLDQALNAFASHAGILLAIDGTLTQGKRSAGLQGRYPVGPGLAELLRGSGLRAVAQPDGSWTLARLPEDAVLLPAVRVQARADDQAATEDSGSYAARAATVGKTAESLREIPQSVSVITRARLDSQNVSSLPEALKYATGVTVQRFDGAGYFNRFNARGYYADTVQLDGINVQYNANMADTDLAVYDRVEIQRGAAGLFQGAGEPGVLINLARKRALAEPRLQGLLSAGSWDSYRAEADVTGALNADGSLRGRLVVVWDDRDSYLDGVFGEKQLAYGTLEYAPGPDTTLSFGVIWQQIDSVIDQGLPAYADGTLLDVPVSTSIVADWNGLDMDTADYFGELEHRLDGGGLIKLALRHLERSRLYKGTRANSAVADNGDFTLQNVYYYTDLDDTSADLFVSLPLRFAGREHDVVFGADYRSSDSGTPIRHNLRYEPASGESNIFAHDLHTAEPELVYGGYGASVTETEQYGAYARTRLRATERFSVLLGARLTWWESSRRDRETGIVSGEYDEEGELTPYGALMFDLGESLSVYASYTDIFKPQNNLTRDLEQIDPRVGAQYEVGIKGEFLDGRVNLHAAVYRLEDENRALTDPFDDQFFVAAGKVRSDGFETEISGELLPHWQLTTGYAYNTNEFLRAAEGQEGQSFAPFTPRHSFNLWTKYSFVGGALDGLDLGGGMRAVSGFSSEFQRQYEAPGYTSFAIQAGYRVRPALSLALNVENLFDRKYYEKVSGAGRQNFYGAPRGLTLSARYAF